MAPEGRRAPELRLTARQVQDRAAAIGLPQTRPRETGGQRQHDATIVFHERTRQDRDRLRDRIGDEARAGERPSRTGPPPRARLDRARLGEITSCD
jgi:hypothetical protein